MSPYWGLVLMPIVSVGIIFTFYTVAYTACYVANKSFD